tara:strand:- start:1517 stop:2572 length:1056 start_codon:yes stop_codon:yes gene_type:complete
MSRRLCIILGASGLVGQRLQQRLVEHPMFKISAIGGSPSTAGLKLEEIPWRLDEDRPNLPNLIVLDINSSDFIEQCIERNIEIAFSALPSDIALDIEKRLVEAGIMVFSNASSFRRKPNIPMIIPEINPHHYHEGLHYCATNCTLIPLALPVSAIANISSIKSVKMRSEQALSGAGWGLLYDEAALRGIVEPNIEGEAEKTTQELLHVMGGINHQEVTPAIFDLEIVCERVSRRDGHQVFVEVKTEKSVKFEEVLDQFRQINLSSELPSKPSHVIHHVEKIDTAKNLWSDGEVFTTNPNPTTDLKTGMAIIVGDLEVEENIIRFSAYSHNTIRGAAGGVVFLAEFVMNLRS